ncbi:NCS1 family nucleobase:cation symporter-1 (plasmid) [Sphingobium sp. SJ10-10]|uniref:NCS1 family nucleobase:cation symporter-1 n=1 Tax=Sphingobium sp. SJ10-10 TaxID=3114999 RepID=UPI002E16F960|nr:NCS1 family nucleobase:cation symporter-1 [Sphingobium sp. SJ10-10]
MAGTDNDLINADLAPTDAGSRTWRWFHYGALWVGMVISIPAYMLAAGLIDQGMTPLQAIFTILLGNSIVLIPMLLVGHAGARYGIPYAVLVRCAFGTTGAKVPAVARAIVACGWFGIQTWVGGNTLLALATVVTHRPIGGAPLPLVGIDAAHLACFTLFWVIQLFFVTKGLDMVRKLETWTAPVKIAICIALLYWAMHHTHGLALGTAPLFTSGFSAIFWPGLTAMIGYWATLALNIPDFTRFAKTQRDQVVGQTIGLPVPMAMLAVVAVLTTAATRIAFGRAIWDPVELATHLPNAGVLIGLLIISIDTVSCNIAANLVGPAYDFAALAPSRISYRGGAFLTAVLAAAIMPWKLIESSGGYIFTWLIGYSALLGPIAGIMITDYWIVRRTRIEVGDLYRSDGRYSYGNGWNTASFVALLVGVLPNVPGFLAEAFPASFGAVPSLFRAIYPYAWFVGGALGSITYCLAMRGERIPVASYGHAQ